MNKQVTDVPKDTHLQTDANEVEWAPLPQDQEPKGYRGDPIPGSPGFSGETRDDNGPRENPAPATGPRTRSHRLK